MNWSEFAYARQLLAEEKVGQVIRQAEHEEDRLFDRSFGAAQRMG